MNTFQNHITSIRRTRSNEKGFTLIELLVVIAILAVLPGLLPAIQDAREAAAHSGASANVNQVIAASREYRNRMGSYPRSVADLIGWNLTPLDPEVAQGNKDGYLYEIVESDRAHCRIEAKPEYAGITGSLIMGAVIMPNDLRRYQILGAGADEAKERMSNNIRAKAAETVARLLSFDNSATAQVREYVDSPDTINDVYNTLDADDDGGVSVEEILTSSSAIHDAELRRPVDQFLSYVAGEMKFDSLNEEKKRTMSVGIADLEQSRRPPLFSYDELRLLTKLWINQPNISNSLCAELETAEAADDEDTGDIDAFALFMRSMKSYQRQVRSLIGQATTGSDAECLITLTEVMIAGY